MKKTYNKDDTYRNIYKSHDGDMKNVYDLVTGEGLFYTVDDNNTDNGNKSLENVAIFCHLYYQNQLRTYVEYIKGLCCFLDVYIISSNSKLIEDGMAVFGNYDRVKLIKKSNPRGRDISSLLVDFKQYLHRYEYFCFIHDKGSKFTKRDDDINFWNYNLWKNLLGSKESVLNILDIFKTGKSIGLLVPPEPYGNVYRDFYSNMWNKNYSMAVELSKKFSLNCSLEENKPPIAIGTAFWCRYDALFKLFDYDWDYQDFPDEPMPDDYTISHVIERMFPYFAQDAGYLTGMVMHVDYLSKLIMKMKLDMTKVFDFLREEHGIKNIDELDHYYERRDQIRAFCSAHNDIYLYGAGRNGKDCLHMLRGIGIEPKGFVVTKHDGDKEVEKLKVYEIDNLKIDDNAAFIICVDYHVQKTVENTLKRNGYEEYISFL